MTTGASSPNPGGRDFSPAGNRNKTRHLGIAFTRRLAALAGSRLRTIAVVWLACLALIVFAAELRPARGLKGRFYNNTAWRGSPFVTSLDTEIRFEKEEMLARLRNADRYSAIWEGFIYVPTDSAYLFEVVSDDGSWVSVDGEAIIDNGGVHPRQEADKVVSLAKGNHALSLRYFDAGGSGEISFRWTRADGSSRRSLPVFPSPITSRDAAADSALPVVQAGLKIAFIALSVLFAAGFVRVGPSVFKRYLSFEQKILAELLPRFSPLLARKRAAVAVFFGAAVLFVLFKAVAPPHGLNGRYYDNPNWTGPPVTTALDPVIHFEKLPMQIRAGEGDAFGVVWDGYLYALKSSTYRFWVASDDAAYVFIDGRLVVDKGGTHPAREMQSEMSLTRGNHGIQIKSFAAGSPGGIDFRWNETRTPRAFMPKLHLYPHPVSGALALLDAVLPHLVPLVKAILIVFGAVLLPVLIRSARPRLGARMAVAVSLFLVVAVLYEAQVFVKRSTAVAGCDTFAYLQGAENMSRNGFFRTEYTDPLIPRIYARLNPKPSPASVIFLMSPHGHYVNDLDKGVVYNTFPPGTSILLYPVVKLFGRAPAFLVLPVFNVLLIILLFVLGTAAVDPVFGLVLSLIAIVNAKVFENSVVIMSDVPSMLLIALSAYLLYRNVRARGRLWPVLAGAFFGFAVVVRYSNLAGAVPCAVLLWLGARPSRRWSDLAADAGCFAAAAFIAGGVPLAVYTNHLFGTVLRLVYEPYNQSRMGLANVLGGLSYYARSVFRTFGVFGAGLMIFGLVSSLAKPRRRALAWVCLAAFAAFFVFYAFQSIRQERYLVPAYPFLAALAAAGAADLVRWVRTSKVLGVAILLLCAFYPYLHSKGTYRLINVNEERIAISVDKKLEPGAVVFCEVTPGPLHFYAGLSAWRFLWTDEDTLKRTLDALLAEAIPVYFFLDSPEAEDRFLEWLGRGFIPKDRARLIGRVFGIPLYRIKPDGR